MKFITEENRIICIEDEKQNLIDLFSYQIQEIENANKFTMPQVNEVPVQEQPQIVY